MGSMPPSGNVPIVNEQTGMSPPNVAVSSAHDGKGRCGGERQNVRGAKWGYRAERMNGGRGCADGHVSAPSLRNAASPASDTATHWAVGRRARDVAVVPVPPFVRTALRIAFRRIFPNLLSPKCGHVEIAPQRAHPLIAAGIDEVGAENPVAFAEEGVVAMPFIDAEVGIEAVGDRVPGHPPAHARLEARRYPSAARAKHRRA